ncbi:MAG: LysR family transcriptional regulator [Lachnospiraceae bacterium]|nr:LysR family transcriptional regulator [Lachnospiraceae bacterium]MDD3617200.1 LysR family transcriptional regulator [Lachnospiraceae bacterium]
MNTKQIDYILELSQTLNFNHAAENLYISQPTMTYQIKLVEDEIGFKIFERSGKGAVLTPAGSQFCTTLRNIRDELKNAIEQGQNFSDKYHEDISIGLPMRSALYFLPEAITNFAQTNPGISVTPKFNPLYNIDAFLKGEQDIVFSQEEYIRRVPDIKIHPLFQSRIYLITEKNDPLAEKKLVTIPDLAGRTLMIGGGSPRILQNLQQRVITTTQVRYFNSLDHETTLTNIAAHKGVCLAPGFLNDHNNEFAWTPFDYDQTISCVLCTHNTDQRENIKSFIKTLQRAYASHQDFPL